MATALSERGHEVTVFTKRYGDHDDGAFPFEVVRIPNWRVNSFFSTLTFLLNCTLALLRRSSEFDVCQCMMVYPNGFLGHVVERLTGLSYFAWIRGGDYYFMKDTWWKRWMIWRVLADTRVLVQGPSIAEDVREDFPDVDLDLHVVGNGVAIPDATAQGEGVLYLGRLAPKKGVDVLLHAMSGLDASLTIVGDGPERAMLEDLAAELDVNVSFVGRVPPERVGEYYRKAGVYCLPSVRGEGLPNTVLEAMSWGLPCVTTDSGALPSVIGEGERGKMVESGDVAALRDALEELLEESSERNRLGRNAREYVVAQHSWDAIASKLEEQYRYVQ
jgi:glycosyltransferase involved in cell wall biosynthesis